MQISSLIRKTVAQFHTIRQDGDALQKICQVAYCIIKGINISQGKRYLEKFTSILDVANIDDFYEILQLPYNLLYQFHPNRLDEPLFLEAFKDNEKLENSAKRFLDYLYDENICFRNKIEFTKALKKWFLKEKLLKKDFCFDQLKIKIKNRPFFEALSFYTFSTTTVGCSLGYLHSWKVLNLSFINIEKWNSIGYCFGYGCRFVDACLSVWDKKQSEEKRDDAKWKAVASAAEFIYNLVIFKKCEEPIFILSMFVAKLLGLVNIIRKSVS